MKNRLLSISRFLVFLVTIFSLGCDPADEKVSVSVDHLVGGLGLNSNIFNAPAEEQLGTIIFYRSRRLIDRFSLQLNFRGETDVVIQVQGHLAEQMLENIVYFSKGTIRSQDDGVVFLFGEIAEGLYEALRAQFTIDDLDYLDGKEMVIVGGTEAFSFLETAKVKFEEYFFYPPKKGKRIFVASAEDAYDWTKELFEIFYDDLGFLFITNPLGISNEDNLKSIFRLPADVGAHQFEGIGQVTLLTGHIWVISFDSVSRSLAYLTGSERIPESVVLKRTVKAVGETGYLVAYTVSNIFRDAAEADPYLDEHGEVRGLWVHPWLTITIASTAIKNSIDLVDFVRTESTEIVVGYISDNMDLLGQFLDLIHANIVGDFFVFVGDEVAHTINVPSLLLKSVIRFTGNGLSALVGTLSPSKPLDAKIVAFKMVWRDFRGDTRELWFEFLEFIGIQ